MTRTWQDNQEILDQFQNWLSQTGEELQALNGQAEADQPSDPLPEVGLQQVVEALTAMRHEVKLETKSSRGLQESMQSALEGLQNASRQFESVQAREREAAEGAAVPILESLVLLDEALARGGQAVEATCRQLTHSAPQRLQDSLEETFRQLSWWRRLLFGGWHRQVKELAGETYAQTTSEELDRLREGYGLIQSRMARILEEHGVERVATVGEKVDPSRMTVVELVEDADAEPETVIDEVRPGYVWSQRVIRFAEVRAAANPPPAVEPLEHQTAWSRQDEEGEGLSSRSLWGRWRASLRSALRALFGRNGTPN